MSEENLTLCAPAAESLAKAEARCRRALEMLRNGRGAPRREVERALAEAPGCVAAHALRLALIVRADDRSALRSVIESIVAIEALCPDPAELATTHAAAASAWVEGDARLALALYAALAADGPQDGLAAAVAEALRRRLERPRKLHRPSPLVFPEWSAVTPGYASVVAMYAFALQRNGQHRRAERTARRALTLEPGRRTALLVLADVPEARSPAQNAGASPGFVFWPQSRRRRPAKADPDETRSAA